MKNAESFRKIGFNQPPLTLIISGTFLNIVLLVTKSVSSFFILFVFILAAIFELFFRKQNRFPSNILSLTLAIVCYFLLNSFSIESDIMKSDSMNPSIPTNSKVVILKWFFKPERGDVVFYRHPKSQKLFVHRLIGLPGETVEIKEGRIFINGNLLKDVKIPQNLNYKNAGEYGKVGQKLEIPNSNYYVLADNSAISSGDSRYFGFVPKENIKGKVISVKPLRS